MSELQGYWAADDPRRIFVEGAEWWELTERGITMWPSDVGRVEAEAERRFPAGLAAADERARNEALAEAEKLFLFWCAEYGAKAEWAWELQKRLRALKK